MGGGGGSLVVLFKINGKRGEGKDQEGVRWLIYVLGINFKLEIPLRN